MSYILSYKHIFKIVTDFKRLYEKNTDLLRIYEKSFVKLVHIIDERIKIPRCHKLLESMKNINNASESKFIIVITYKILNIDVFFFAIRQYFWCSSCLIFMNFFCHIEFKINFGI